MNERKHLLVNYIDSAMEKVSYEIIEDEGTYGGEIPGLQGVWARHEILEGCRRALRVALSDWIALRLGLDLPIPDDLTAEQRLAIGWILKAAGVLKVIR